METIAVYVNDASQAEAMLRPMLAAGAAPAHWLLVLCPPKLSRHIGRLTSRRSRDQWRSRWAADLEQDMRGRLAGITGPGARLEALVASGPLSATTGQLRRQHGTALRLLDARQSRVGVALEPLVVEAGGAAKRQPVAAPVAAVSTLSLVLALAD